MRILYPVAIVAIGLWLLAGSSAAAMPPVLPGGNVHVDVQPGAVHVDAGGVRIGEAGPIARVTDLIGLKVLNAANENLGRMENLVLDTSSGRIRYAVISCGGMLGFGEKLVAIPFDQLRMVSKETDSTGMQAGTHFVLDLSADILKNAPSFTKDRWPNFADRTWSVEIDKYYQIHRTARRALREGQERR